MENEYIYNIWGICMIKQHKSGSYRTPYKSLVHKI